MTNLRDEDWLRTRTWDLPESLSAFLSMFSAPEEIKHFLTLPAAEPMPTDLRTQVMELLDDPSEEPDEAQ